MISLGLFSWLLPLVIGWLLGQYFAQQSAPKRAASDFSLNESELKTLIEQAVSRAQSPLIERLDALETTLLQPKPVANPSDGLLVEPEAPISFRTIRTDRST